MTDPTPDPSVGLSTRPVRALVTGGGGFVGAHLVARLVDEGCSVLATCRPGAPAWRLEALGLTGSSAGSSAGPDPLPRPAGHRQPLREHGPQQPGYQLQPTGHPLQSTGHPPQERAGRWPQGRVEVVAVDLTDPVAIASLARDAEPDLVFHLAAARADADADERARTSAVNTMSGQWMVEALADSCRAVVRLGSSTEYAQVDGPTDEAAPLAPRGYFGATKAAGSLLLAAAAARRGLRAAILRAFQVYGPLDHPGRLVPTVLRAAAEGTPLPLTGPGRRRDWVHVHDVVEACWRAAQSHHLPPGQVLNVGTGRQVANEELVALASRVTGRRIDTLPCAHPGRHWDTGSWVCDPGLAARLLGWRAEVALEEGLSRCWAALGHEVAGSGRPGRPRSTTDGRPS